jgi:Na+-transporting methylmalonyl-CoA/oxaloacetate decarboxylase beta subunit
MLGNILKTVLGVLLSAFTPPQASSIGIIGGADGPTAIYVTHTLSPYVVLSAVAIAAYLFLQLTKNK